MFAKAIVAAIFALITTPVWAADCNPTDFQSNIVFCKNSCDTSGHQPECNGSGTMATTARGGDAAGVIRGFEVCHPDRHGNDQTKDEIAEACANQNPRQVLSIACAVYGGCPSAAPPPPPASPIKSIDYNQPMVPASDNKQIIIADFLLNGSGQFQTITMNFTRDGINVFNMSTYASSVIPESGKLHVKITTYDKTVSDVSKHKYSVAGTVIVNTQ